MNSLIIKELAAFKDELRRDVIVDAMGKRVPVTDREFLKQVTAYGNAYLEAAKSMPENAGAVLWFDIYFSDPAVIGMTWAYNPGAPVDPVSGLDYFWRIWSETNPQGGVLSLTGMQMALGSYIMRRGG